MKKLLNLTLVAVLMFSLFSCKKDDQPIATQSQPLPLKVELNKSSFVMGDILKITLSVDDTSGTASVTNNNLNVYLSAKEDGEDAANTVFEGFSEKVLFPKGKSKIEIEIPIKESGITSSHEVQLTVSVRGHDIKNASQTIIVSNYHYTSVSLKDNSDGEILEGKQFVLMASIDVPAIEKVTIDVSPKAGEEDVYGNLPESLTIPVGETSVESDSITLKADGIYTGDQNLTLSFSTTSTKHPLLNTEITILEKDIDKPLGTKIEDERWVYDNPNIAFVSSKNKAAILEWTNSDIQVESIGDPHPKLGGWSFYNAMEFPFITSCFSGAAPNKYGNYVPKGFFNQNTAATQVNMAVDNGKYSSVMEEGYLRMWASKDPTQATGGASGMRDYGTAAFYSSHFRSDNGSPFNQYAPMHTRIFPGMRIEVRARIRGEKNGFNFAIWLQGIAQDNLPWPEYGEIDILENPVGPVTGENKAFQTFHYTDQGDGDVNPSHSEVMPNIKDWNIYWVEFVDASTVKMGINGETTITIKKEDMADPSLWPYDKTINPEGFYFILSMGGPSDWAFGSSIPTDWDSGFAGISYQESKTNPNTPRMEVDWIRYYTNANYDVGNKSYSKVKLY